MPKYLVIEFKNNKWIVKGTMKFTKGNDQVVRQLKKDGDFMIFPCGHGRYYEVRKGKIKKKIRV